MLPIFLVVLVDVFGLTLVIPLIAIYAETFGASPLQATLLVSVYAGCQLISGPILGALSDRYGRKRLLILSQLGTFAGFLLMANATSLWMLFVARMIDGATAGNLTLAQAWISDHTPPEKRTKSFALIGIAFGLGFFLGPAVTGVLVAKHSMAAPIYLAAALSATSVLCTLFLLPKERGTVQGEGEGEGASGPAGRRVSVLSWRTYSELFSRPVLGGLLLQFFLFLFAFSTFTSGFALFAERSFTWNGHPWGVREVGYLFAYLGFLGIILQGGLMGRLVQRFGDAALVTSGFLSAVVAYAALGFIDSVGAIIVVGTIASYGTGVLRPALTSLISQQAGRHEQGRALGVSQSLGSVASIFAPALAGLLIEHGFLSEWAWTAAASLLLGFLAKRWGSARVQRPAPSAPAP